MTESIVCWRCSGIIDRLRPLHRTLRLGVADRPAMDDTSASRSARLFCEFIHAVAATGSAWAQRDRISEAALLATLGSSPFNESIQPRVPGASLVPAIASTLALMSD